MATATAKKAAPTITKKPAPKAAPVAAKAGKAPAPKAAPVPAKKAPAPAAKAAPAKAPAPKPKAAPAAPAADDIDLDIDEAPADEAPADDQAGDEVAEDQDTPADDEAPADEAAADEAAAAEDQEDQPADEAPADEAPADDQAGGDTQGTGTEFDFAEGFETCKYPIDQIKLNPASPRTDAEVDGMAKSIRQNGLQNPIVVGTDGTIIQGNTRFLAYKKLGKKWIPARIGMNVKGTEQVSSADPDAFFAMLVENIQRNGFSPITQATLFKQAIDNGLSENANALAQRLGLAASTVTRSLALLEKATKPMREALEAGTITGRAADLIISKTDTPAKQQELLNNLLDASAGKKISRDDVAKAAPAKTSNNKQGRKASKYPLGSEALKSEESGITGVMIRNVDKTVEVVFQFSLALEADTFARFDYAAKVQAKLASLDPKAVRAELEAVRQRLAD